MQSAVWRTVLLSLCAISAFFAVATAFCVIGIGDAPPWSGRWGWGWGSVQIPFGIQLDAVDPGGPADRAGLRAGDKIDLRKSSLQERYWVMVRALNGRPVALWVQRGAVQKRVAVTPTRLFTTLNIGGWWRQFWIFIEIPVLQPALVVWLAFFAGLIAWRRSGVRQMRLLALTLVVYSLSWVLGNFHQWTTPWLWSSVLQDFGTALGPAAIALWILLSSTFGRPLSAGRRIVQWVCYAMIAAQIGLNVASTVGFITLWFDWNAPTLSWLHLGEASIIGGFVCSILAIAASRGAERQRSAWILVPLVLLFSFPLVEEVLLLLYPTSDLVNVVTSLRATVPLVVPAALTYAALSRRLIDIGFVLNRAAVFSGVSFIVVGIFMLVEWMLGTSFSRASHLTSVVISAALAVGLGFSVRAIHTRVDRVLDHIFFRKRHEDETAIRAFADEAADITNDATLLYRAKEMLETHADASFVSFALGDGAGRYGDVSENDPAIVALRDRRKALDLQTLSTELRGEFAYPMIAQGRLFGALVLGPKRHGESYAPDESSAIMQLARTVGGTLYALSLAKVLQEHHLQA
ncbi:MAG TPA: hypothetical protein VGX91_01310 [Candidatus Cybelea sp.]|jgi:hypothetical protein|nr:hypothetical protein [Candidatus Cybelea sp.]